MHGANLGARDCCPALHTETEDRGGIIPSEPKKTKLAAKTKTQPTPKRKAVTATKNPRNKTGRKATTVAEPVPASQPDGGISYQEREPSLLVAGVGASAGGLEALEELFANTPADCGIAFIVVVHLDPGHSSLLPELLSRGTQLKVSVAKQGLRVEPNHVYVIPPDKELTIQGRELQVIDRDAVRRGMLVDELFESLAREHGDSAAGIVLSGMGSDGTQGLRAIKEGAGLTIVQDPDSAKFRGMPESAINAGLADIVLKPHAIARKLTEFARNLPPRRPVSHGGHDRAYLHRIFVLLQNKTGHDFSNYKQSTVLRRIERRMSANGASSMAEYVQLLQRNPHEVSDLFRELLIRVTSFFRDPACFTVLESKVIPALLQDKPRGYTVRVWIPGVATGEEAYTLAMLLQEYIDEHEMDYTIQIFATDIDEDAIEKARAGWFPVSIAKNLTPARLKRFFDKDGKHYRIKRDIREALVFAAQNVIKDPPFMRLDLISCRNLLIYLDSQLQKKLLPVFHYSLNKDGILLLGTSESIGEFSTLFDTMDAKWKIFRKKETAPIPYPIAGLPAPFKGKGRMRAPAKEDKARNLGDICRDVLLRDFVPPSIIANVNGDILYIHGRTGKYLEPSEGRANLNILEMAREGLHLQLPGAFRRAATRKEKVILENVRVRSNGGFQNVKVTIMPLAGENSAEDLVMVLFQEADAVEDHGSAHRISPKAEKQVLELEAELKSTKENLQTFVEDMATTNEELKSVNEEFQSTNEELKSANEELETSREEMQSLNEELTTVNSELQAKIRHLSQTHEDMRRFLDSLGIPTIFLDNDLRIKRFTSQSSALINVIETDVGRPIGHIVTNLKYNNLVQDALNVRKTGRPIEREIQTQDGQWYLLRVLPYQTSESRVDGIVITFVNIHQLRATATQLHDAEKALDFAQSVLNAVRHPLLVLNHDLQVLTANGAYEQAFHATQQEMKGHSIFEVGRGMWNVPKLRDSLENVLPRKHFFKDVVVEEDFPGLGRRCILLNARQFKQKGVFKDRIILAIEDDTGKGTR